MFLLVSCPVMFMFFHFLTIIRFSSNNLHFALQPSTQVARALRGHALFGALFESSPEQMGLEHPGAAQEAAEGRPLVLLFKSKENRCLEKCLVYVKAFISKDALDINVKKIECIMMCLVFLGVEMLSFLKNYLLFLCGELGPKLFWGCWPPSD